MSVAKKKSPSLPPEPDGARDVVLGVGFQSEGVTYRLHPLTQERVGRAFPGVRAAPSVYVGYATKADFESLHGPMWRQVLALLTGVDYERLRALGRVVLWDPMTGQTWEVE